MLTNCPERVFLQIGDDCPDDANFEALKGVTWCARGVAGNDIEYLRADAVAAAVFKVLADVEALARARNAPHLAGLEMALDEVRTRLGTSELRLTKMLGEQAAVRESQAVISAYLAHASTQVLPSGPEMLKALWGDGTEPVAEEEGALRETGSRPQVAPVEPANGGTSTSELVHGAAKLAGFPAKCPITHRDFFMVLEHPELGLIPTYGGPLDSYTMPEMEGRPDDEFHERSLFVHRYDHDRGEWVDDESINLRVIEESALHELQRAATISCDKGQEAKSVATPEAIDALRANAEALQKLFEIFGVGSSARTLPVLLANVTNAQRRSLCLAAVEREFFTVESESDDGTDEPGEECHLNWGAEPEAYIEQFRSELQHLTAKTVATRRNNVASLEALDIPGLRSAIRMFTPNMRDWIGKALDRLEAADTGDADRATTRSGSAAE